MKEVPCFQSLQSRCFEAPRGLAEATPRTQNVLAQGQSEAYGDSKLYNTIVEVPARLNLKHWGPLLGVQKANVFTAHVVHLCQSTMLFGIVWVLLSQAFAAWRG